MRHWGKVLFFILAVYPLLFVVVCPDTPTPTAVMKGKSDGLWLQPLVLPSVVFLLVPQRVWHFEQSTEIAPEPRPLDLIALECQRLC